MDSYPSHLSRILSTDDKAHSLFISHMVHNTPCLLTDIHTHTWPLHHYFISPLSLFNPSKFTSLCGDQIISVHNMNRNNKEDMCINEFIQRIQLNESLYAKDWHMFTLCSTDLYTVPQLFIDDWLNWYWSRCRSEEDDYRFVYIGGKDTFTGVHHDVLCSYSWSVNIYGRKRWYMWPPEQVPLLYNHSLTSHVVDARDGHYDPVEFPYVSQTSPLIIEQDVGDAIFVPSGWYHMVENLGSDHSSNEEITVSLNHNWMNGFNIYEAWRFLLREFNSVRRELWEFHPYNSNTDPRMLMTLPEWIQQCELVMQANSSMTSVEFVRMMCVRCYSLVQAGHIHNSDNINWSPPALLLRLDTENCRNIRGVVQDLDTRIYHILCQQIVESPIRDQSNLLSSILNQRALDTEKEHPSSVHLNYDAECIASGYEKSFPMSALQYSFTQVLKVLEELVHCDEVVTQLSHVLCTDTDLLKSELSEYVMWIVSNM